MAMKEITANPWQLIMADCQPMLHSLSNNSEDHGCDAHHGLAMKATDLSSAPGSSNNVHHDDDNPTITNNHGRNHSHDQAMTISDV